MITQELLDYIAKEKQRGVPEDVLRQTLLAAGWAEPDVAEAFSGVLLNRLAQLSPTTTQHTQKSIIAPFIVALICIGVGAVAAFAYTHIHGTTLVGAAKYASMPLVSLTPSPKPKNAPKGNTVMVHILGTSRPPGFSPSLITIHLNDTVTFVNDATPAATYTIVAKDKSFRTPPLSRGQQYSMTFNQQGTHEYNDATNDVQMVGEIIVVPQAIQDAITNIKQQYQSSASASITPTP